MNVKIALIFSLLLFAGLIVGFTDSVATSEYTAVVYNQSDSPLPNRNFDKMMDVLTHQRCMNCHPNDNIPKQGDESHPHNFGVAGGENDHGFQAIKCTTC
ncbi:hypothetical protein LCGC14_2387630, partial [marine sediment metagenome]